MRWTTPEGRGHGTGAVALAAVATLALLLGGCGHPAAASGAGTRARSAASAARSGDRPRLSFGAPITVVATTHGSIPAFAAPGGTRRGTVPGTWFDAPSVLPVLASEPGWLEVRLAQRPNESTAWVLARDVTLATTPYRIVIDLRTTHLELLRQGRTVLSAPVGIGTRRYPTPTGQFFVAFFATAPNPGYGAFVMVTSAHSDTITDWERSGDALVAIHGPLGADRLIGTTGAAISHGCIRLHDTDLLRLRVVPVGSPVDIVAG